MEQQSRRRIQGHSRPGIEGFRVSFKLEASQFIFVGYGALPPPPTLRHHLIEGGWIRKYSYSLNLWFKIYDLMGGFIIALYLG